MVGQPATCDGLHGAVAAVAAGDGETQCLKVRSDEVWDGPSLRSQAATAPCGFTHRRRPVVRPSCLLFHRHRHDDRLEGIVVLVTRNRCNFFHDIHAADDFAEDAVPPIQAAVVRQTDKEL